MNLPDHLRSLEDYYLWASQANTFHPRFDELTQEARKQWADEYERARSSTGEGR